MMDNNALVHHQLSASPMRIGDGEGYCVRRVEPVRLSVLHRCYLTLKRNSTIAPLIRTKPDLFCCAECGDGHLKVIDNADKANMFYYLLSVVHDIIELELLYCDGCDKEHLFLKHLEDAAPCRCEKCGRDVLVFGTMLVQEGAVNYAAPSQQLVTELSDISR
jgi:hypothetical protein